MIGLFRSEKAQIIDLEPLENALKTLSAKVDSLESGHKKLALEWEELYDKVRHQMSRMARRQRLENQDLVSQPEPEPDPNGQPVLDPISRSIMMRRSIGRFGQ